jgi:hypothetical protein
MTIFEKKKLKLLDTVLVSDTLKKLGDKPEKGKTKVSEILEDFHENGILLALIFFALPVAIPLPYPPGFTTIMGTPLIILAIQMLLGSKKVKLPQKVNDYEIKNSTLKMISLKTVPALIALEKFIKPRGGFAKSVACEQFVGFVSLIGGISVAIPLPLTNAVPALGITVMALGLLNRDLLVIFVGLIIEIIGIFIALGALLASWVAIKYLFNMVF